MRFEAIFDDIHEDYFRTLDFKCVKDHHNYILFTSEAIDFKIMITRPSGGKYALCQIIYDDDMLDLEIRTRKSRFTNVENIFGKIKKLAKIQKMIWEIDRESII